MQVQLRRTSHTSEIFLNSGLQGLQTHPVPRFTGDKGEDVIKLHVEER